MELSIERLSIERLAPSIFQSFNLSFFQSFEYLELAARQGGARVARLLISAGPELQDRLAPRDVRLQFLPGFDVMRGIHTIGDLEPRQEALVLEERSGAR